LEHRTFDIQACAWVAFSDITEVLKLMGRISLEHLSAAVRKVELMQGDHQVTLFEEIRSKQPALFGICVAQTRLGTDEQTFAFLMNLLLTCYVAMAESGFEWSEISVGEVEREMERVAESALFADEPDKTAARADCAQYMHTHSEKPLLTLVLSECVRWWLLDPVRRRAKGKAGPYAQQALVTLVNCIAHSPAEPRRTFD
jgi:hypothetical protein